MCSTRPTRHEIEAANAIKARRCAKVDALEALAAVVLRRLLGSVWHTTNSERFQGILHSEAILPEPIISDTARWSTSRGSKWYPYVRTLGGISLFDFRDFDPDQYSITNPASSWREFVPYRSKWKEAVWIEIDTSQLGNTFISGHDLLDRWRAQPVGNRLMPKIEAAHLGPLPQSAFKAAFLVREGSHELSTVELKKP